MKAYVSDPSRLDALVEAISDPSSAALRTGERTLEIPSGCATGTGGDCDLDGFLRALEAADLSVDAMRVG